MSETSETRVDPTTIGTPEAKIRVRIGPRFLHHFSEQLYSSPQKAFEELVSNGWDAGADFVDIRVSSDLTSESATLAVVDNGVSMDREGLADLWHVAFSPKQGVPEAHGRKIIGKFGIGKLATYVLANKLTYICKASDGVIRRVTMDYSDIGAMSAADAPASEVPNGSNSNAPSIPNADEELVRDVPLLVHVATLDEVTTSLKTLDYGHDLAALIERDVTAPERIEAENEFGGDVATVSRTSPNTWTLVILSDLKKAGRQIKTGVLKRMLSAALPFGQSMLIHLNGQRLAPQKRGLGTVLRWVIGKDLSDLDIKPALKSSYKLDSNDIEDDGGEDGEAAANEDVVIDGVDVDQLALSLTAHDTPYFSVSLPHVGEVTGTVTVFEDKVTGGKSAARGASNGFHVNVLGRVVNQADTAFGEKNLNHAVWSRFRMAVRADGLNTFITTDRERFRDCLETRIFRAFLRSVFNKARTEYDADPNADLHGGGDYLVNNLGVVSLNPLRNVVLDCLKTGASPVPGLIDTTGIDDPVLERKKWREETAGEIRKALSAIIVQSLPEQADFVRFRLRDRSIVMNSDHPISSDANQAQKKLLRTMAMVTLLSDVYALDCGVDPEVLGSVREHRDRLMRIHALQNRRTGGIVASYLRKLDSDRVARIFPSLVVEALQYLGFLLPVATGRQKRRIAYAYAYAMPSKTIVSDEEERVPLYTVAYGSSLATIADESVLQEITDRQQTFDTNHALLVVSSATAWNSISHNATPLLATDLARMLDLTAGFGVLPITKIREMFAYTTTRDVSRWVDGLEGWLRKNRPLKVKIFLSALEALRGKVPDALSAGTVAYACRELVRSMSIRNEDVLAIARGLSTIVPDLVGVEGDKIIVNADPSRVADAVHAELEKLRAE